MKKTRSQSLTLHYSGLYLVLVMFVLGGCTSVPKESVELSQEVGKGIVESQRAYVALLNIYFASKKQQVDQWIESEYLPEYLTNVQSGLKAAGHSTTLTPKQLSEVLRDVIVERDQKQTDLENTRLFLLMKSNESYTLLFQGNSSVTGLLQSIVDLKEATASASEIIKTTSEGKVDLENIEKKFNEYLKRSGTASAEATNLYGTIKSSIEKKGD